jgi:hypothetical protein
MKGARVLRGLGSKVYSQQALAFENNVPLETFPNLSIKIAKAKL